MVQIYNYYLKLPTKDLKKFYSFPKVRQRVGDGIQRKRLRRKKDPKRGVGTRKSTIFAERNTYINYITITLTTNL